VRFKKLVQTQEGFNRLLAESTRWPFQSSLEFPEVSSRPPKRQRTRIPSGNLSFQSRKMGATVACESGAEHAFCAELDRLPRVLHYFEQPDVIYYHFKGSSRRYYPDFLLSFTDGRSVIVEVKQGRDMVLFKNIAKWEALARHCETKGYGFYIGDAFDSIYRLFHTPVPVRLLETVAGEVALRHMGWSRATELRDQNHCANRLLLATICQLGIVVDADYRLRMPSPCETPALAGFRRWMSNVNEETPRPSFGPTHLFRLNPEDPHPAQCSKAAARAGAKWSAREEKILLREFRTGKDMKSLALFFRRTPNAIGVRLHSLGLIGNEEGQSSTG
jgi:hypothetical protein